MHLARAGAHEDAFVDVERMPDAVHVRAHHGVVAIAFARGALGTPVDQPPPITVDDAPWRWADASDTGTIDVRGLPPGPHKIMLDLVASSKRPVRFTEVPYQFRKREVGRSKLDLNVGIEYLYLVADKLIGRWLPITFVLYCLVGAVGVAVHLSILWLLFSTLGYRFENALVVAIAVALLANYSVNNILTYRERRLRGWAFVTGLVVYALACSVGNLSNYALAKLLVDRGVWWPLAN